MHGRTNFAALDRGLSGAMMSGNQKDNPIARDFRALEGDIDCAPRLLEIKPVEIHDAIWLDGAGAKLAVPSPVERRAGSDGPWCRRR